jgi:RNA polymerase sigma factor (sigma-70 family)
MTVNDRTLAIEALYRERYSTFRDVLTGVTGNYESSREVVQEAFARALREQKSFRGDGSLEAWVWKIAFRLALGDRRRPKPVGENGLEAVADAPYVDDSIRAAVRQLPPKRRLVVFLRYFADLSYAEIAEACEISEGTVAATLSQARDELLGLLEQQEVTT